MVETADVQPLFNILVSIAARTSEMDTGDLSPLKANVAFRASRKRVGFA